MLAEFGNLDPEEMCKKYGVSNQTIKRWAMFYGLDDTIGLERIPTKEQIENDIETLGMYKASQKNNVGYHQFKKWCYIRGIELDTPYQRVEVKGFPKEREQYFLQQYYLGLMDESDIHAETGVSPSTIALWLAEDFDIRFIPIEPEFVDDVKVMTVRELAEHYGVKPKVIVAWGKLSKITFEKGF
jgi:uncharacterized protein YjcR